MSCNRTEGVDVGFGVWNVVGVENGDLFFWASGLEDLCNDCTCDNNDNYHENDEVDKHNPLSKMLSLFSEILLIICNFVKRFCQLKIFLKGVITEIVVNGPLDF